MAQGLIVDSLRGMCGTGIYAYSPKSKEASEFKRALPGADFVNSHQFDLFKENVSDFSVVIGHNRASTIGAAKDSNCHPFLFDHIGLVHNGTLRDYGKLSGSFNHPVDSAHAAYSMAKNGTLHTLERVKGAYVFAWHDQKEGTFNIARNGMRDIWFITNKENDTLFFASEYKMLDWVLNRNDIDIGEKLYRNPGEFTLCSWELGKPFKKPKVKAYEEFKEPPVTYQSWHGRSGNEYQDLWKHRDAQELQKLNLDLAMWVELENPVYATYSSSGPTDWSDGVLSSKQKVRQKDGTDIEILFKVHNVKYTDWKTKYSSWPKIGAKAYSSHLENRTDPASVVVVCRVLSEPPEEEKEEEQSKLDGFFRGPQGRFVSKDDFSRLIAAGCVYCGDPIDFRDEKGLKWFYTGTEHDPLCPTCSSNKAIVDEMKGYYGIESSGMFPMVMGLTDRFDDYHD